MTGSTPAPSWVNDVSLGRGRCGSAFRPSLLITDDFSTTPLQQSRPFRIIKLRLSVSSFLISSALAITAIPVEYRNIIIKIHLLYDQRELADVLRELQPRSSKRYNTIILLDNKRFQKFSSERLQSQLPRDWRCDRTPFYGISCAFK